MVNYCRVLGCHKRSDKHKELQFYRLPKIVKNQGEMTEKLSTERRRLWIDSLKQNFHGKNMDNIRICSAHFVEGQKAELYRNNSPNWIPSLAMTSDSTDDTPSIPIKSERHRKIPASKKESQSVSSIEGLICLPESLPPSPEIIEVQPDIGGEYLDSLREEIQSLRSANFKMEKRLLCLENKYELESFEGKDEKVAYYTGIQTFHILVSVFTLLQPHVPENKTLNKFKMYILTLMKFRLNVPLSFLAYEFGISQSAVSSIILEMTDVMYINMKSLVRWPRRDELILAMQRQSTKDVIEKVAIFIDCFEVFIDWPKYWKSRARSSYKHHNTLKFLVAITPQGTISFVSQAYVGKCSSKFITEQSGILDNMLPGDLVLADSEFDLDNTLGMYAGELTTPLLSEGKSKLIPLAVEELRKIAYMRIHVEGFIGLLSREYKILKGPLPTDSLKCKEDEVMSPFEKVCIICSALINKCDSLIDFY